MFLKAVVLCVLLFPAIAQEALSPIRFHEEWNDEVPTAGATVLGISYTPPEERVGDLFTFAGGSGGGRLCVRLRSRDGRYRGLAEFDWPATAGWRRLNLSSRFPVILSAASKGLPVVAWHAPTCDPGALGRSNLQASPLRWGQASAGIFVYFYLNTSKADAARVRVNRDGRPHETECERVANSTVYDRSCRVLAGPGRTKFTLVTEFMNQPEVSAVEMELP